jgi:hypothetical protein
MTFEEWAYRWPEAAKELRNTLVPQTAFPMAGKSEAAVQQQVRYDAAKSGDILWRNNLGMFMDDRGVPVRYGLANDSKQMNQRVKSADLVGIRRVLITPAMVGTTVGVFMSRECKHGDWRWTGSDREQAQLAWASLVWSFGGDAAIVTA